MAKLTRCVIHNVCRLADEWLQNTKIGITDGKICLENVRKLLNVISKREGVIFFYSFLLVKKNYKIEGDVSVMTYRGHSLLRCLSRAHFSPLETTGQVDVCIFSFFYKLLCSFGYFLLSF